MNNGTEDLSEVFWSRKVKVMVSLTRDTTSFLDKIWKKYFEILIISNYVVVVFSFPGPELEGMTISPPTTYQLPCGFASFPYRNPANLSQQLLQLQTIRELRGINITRSRTCNSRSPWKSTFPIFPCFLPLPFLKGCNPFKKEYFPLCWNWPHCIRISSAARWGCMQNYPLLPKLKPSVQHNQMQEAKHSLFLCDAHFIDMVLPLHGLKDPVKIKFITSPATLPSQPNLSVFLSPSKLAR